MGRGNSEWWNAQELLKLESYCRDDVRLTRDLYEFGRANGYVLYAPKDGGAFYEYLTVAFSQSSRIFVRDEL